MSVEKTWVMKVWIPRGHEGGGLLHNIGSGSLVSLPPPQKTAIVKHILATRVKCPVIPLTGIARLPRDLQKTVI